MPELPEVERARRLVEETCVGRAVTEVLTEEGGGGPRNGEFDEIVCRSSAAELRRALVDKTCTAACRVGKQLWLEFEGGARLMVHFGMTGALVVRGVRAATFVEFKVHDAAWPPRFAKLELAFGGGGGGRRLAFCDPRRLGRVSVLRVPPRSVPPVSLLAPDPTAGGFCRDRFSTALNSRAVAIKAALLDQNCAVCGVGNWIADEVLYQARIHPAARSNSLSKEQEGALFTAVGDVVATACAVGAESSSFPDSWMFHVRWRKKGAAGGKGAPLRLGGEPVSFITVGGRTSAVVPSQLKGAGKAAAGEAKITAAQKRPRAQRKDESSGKRSKSTAR